MPSSGSPLKKLAPSDREFLAAVGRRMRAARGERGLTQKELGRLAGVHEVHVSRLEAGLLDSRPLTLQKVSDALQVPLASLFSDSPTERNGPSVIADPDPT